MLYDQTNTDYGERNENGTTVKAETQVIKSNLCGYSDSYILVTGHITATCGNSNTRAAFKSCASFTKCMADINDKQVDNSDNLDITMPMQNLIECSGNYPDTSGSLWQFKRDKKNMNNTNPANITTADSSSFKCNSSFFKPLESAIMEYLKT